VHASASPTITAQKDQKEHKLRARASVTQVFYVRRLADKDETGFQLAGPRGITVDTAHGIIYVADTDNHRICKIERSNDEDKMTVFAGSTTNGSTDDTGIKAKFNQPAGLACDDTALYVADISNNRIRKITSDGKVTTFAGAATSPGTGGGGWQDGKLDVAKFNAPNDIFYHRGEKKWFIADTGNHRIRMIENGAVKTIAGGAAGAKNGNGEEATFDCPTGVCANIAGDRLYIADSNNNVIRLLNLTNGEVTTFAGVINKTGGDHDGPAAEARFNTPTTVSVEFLPGAGGDIVYVSDTKNNKIKKIARNDKDEWVVETVAGTGVAGSDDGTAVTLNGGAGTATLDQPKGLFAQEGLSDKHGIVFVDSGVSSCRVRIIDTTPPKQEAACRMCGNECAVM